MYKKISRTSEIIARLQLDGKVTLMNSVDDMAKIKSMNNNMEEVRRDFRMKESQSQISASHVVLNA